MAQGGERDASGNVRYGDIGVFLRDAINEHFSGAAMRDQPQVHRSQLRHPERAGDGRTIRHSACCSDRTPYTPA